MRRALWCATAFAGGFLFAAWLQSLSGRAQLWEALERLADNYEYEDEDEENGDE